MQDREETSFTEVTGRGPYSDRTCPIKMLGNGSVSSSDRTLRILVTGRDDDIVHYRDNSSALTGRWR